nr:Metridin ShK toxin domain containing protein [Haemonchus contortus]
MQCPGSLKNNQLRAAAGPPLAGAPPQEVPIEQDESCYNQNPCCATWANRGGCTQDPARTKIICAASCGACTPQNPITDGKLWFEMVALLFIHTEVLYDNGKVQV